MNNRKIAIIAKHHPILIDKLSIHGYEAFYIPPNELLRDSELLRSLYGIIISNSLVLDSKTIDRMPSLRVIGRLGSGMEIVDVAYAHDRNITCLSSPEGNANAVAEHALGMLLSLKHHIHLSHNSMVTGAFERDIHTGVELETLTVGILGYGNNGSAFASKLADMGCKVIAYDILTDKIATHPNIEIVYDIKNIQMVANCISLHIPYHDLTRHLIDEKFIREVRNNFILINCARGGLVDTVALLQGLDNGKISGACIDVWEYEPINLYPEEIYDPLMKYISSGRIIATPHIAGYSTQATYKMSDILADKIIAL